MSFGAKEPYRSGAFNVCADPGASAAPVALSLVPARMNPARRRLRDRVHRADRPGRGTFIEAIRADIETRAMALIREHTRPGDLSLAELPYARRAANEGFEPVR